MQDTDISSASTSTGGTDIRPPRRTNRRLLRWIGIPVGTLLGLFLLAGVACRLVLTPARLTPLVERLAGEYLEATVRFDTVRLSLFRHFPHASLELTNGEILSHAFSGDPDSLRQLIPAAADTLLHFDRFSATIDLHRLFVKRVALRQVELTRPRVYAFIAPNGKANWEIFPADTTAADTAALDWGLFLRRLVVDGGGEVVYESRPDSLLARVVLDSLAFQGRRENRYGIDLACRTTLRSDTLLLCDTLPLALHGGVGYDIRDPFRVGMDELALELGGLPALLDGEVRFSEDSLSSDLRVRMNPWHLQRVLGLVPPQMAPQVSDIRTSLVADMNATLKGAYHFTSGDLPALTLDCIIDGGALHYKGVTAAVEELKTDLSLRYDPRRPDSTGVVIRHIALRGAGISLSGSASVWDALGNARIQTDLEGSLDLDALQKLFPLPEGARAHGRVGWKAAATVRKNQLTLARIGQGRLNAGLDLDNVLLDLPNDSIRLLAYGGHIRFGANENRAEYDSTTVIPRGRQVIYLALQADSLQLQYKQQMQVVAAGARLRMRNAASVLGGDTTVVHPFNGSAEIRYLELDNLDSTWVKTEEASAFFSLKPSPENPGVPLLNLELGAMGIALKDQVDYYQLGGTDLRLEATLSPDQPGGARAEARLDSLQRLYPEIPRDSLYAHLRTLRTRLRQQDDFASEDIDLTVDDRITSLLRRWDAKGSIYAINGQAATPYFPLPTALKNVDITFTTNEVDLNGTRIEAGSSQMQLTGRIGNIRRALAGRDALQVDMKLASDTLDLNELMLAVNAGLFYAASDQAHKDSLLRLSTLENAQQLYNETAIVEEEPSPLIVIPANVEVTANLAVNHGIYADLVLRSVTGELTVRDRCLHLNGLKAVTDAGEMDLTALYATRSRSDITAGFDLEMHRMQVERLISLLPAMDTLLPMLRSFEGVVDCQVAATVALDTVMNFILPTLHGVARMYGENMVLLDGETFADIAKMLKFRNRNRNLIDQISVEAIVSDNQIELFPFVIEMDRYRAAVSGIQRLDMSFNYHISVLRSPIPFRLGINISGTPDKFRFRLGRARYKDVHVPTYVELIDSTRLNLRRTIHDVFRRGVEAASLGQLRLATAVQAPPEVHGEPEEGLSVADSLLLRQQGVLPADTHLSIDTLPDSLAMAKTPQPKSSPREQRRERRSERQAKRNGEAIKEES